MCEDSTEVEWHEDIVDFSKGNVMLMEDVASLDRELYVRRNTCK
jgi:hypothetical protein